MAVRELRVSLISLGFTIPAGPTGNLLDQTVRPSAATKASRRLGGTAKSVTTP